MVAVALLREPTQLPGSIPVFTLDASLPYWYSLPSPILSGFGVPALPGCDQSAKDTALTSKLLSELCAGSLFAADVAYDANSYACKARRRVRVAAEDVGVHLRCREGL
jgi:hypothetical protein